MYEGCNGLETPYVYHLYSPEDYLKNLQELLADMVGDN